MYLNHYAEDLEKLRVDDLCLYAYELDAHEYPQRRIEKTRYCAVCGGRLATYNLSKTCYRHKEPARAGEGRANKKRRQVSGGMLAVWRKKHTVAEGDECLGMVKGYEAKLQRAWEMGYPCAAEMYRNLYLQGLTILGVSKATRAGTAYAVRDYLMRAGVELRGKGVRTERRAATRKPGRKYTGRRYEGKPCKVCGGVERYRCNCACVLCEVERNRRKRGSQDNA